MVEKQKIILEFSEVGMKFLSVILCVLVLSGCSTHRADITYQSESGLLTNTTAVINKVSVTDERGTDADWLGAIRGGFGNPIKTLRTETPTAEVVETMFIQALERNNLYANLADLPYALVVQMVKFDCSQYLNREAHVTIEVSVLDSQTSATLFSKSYKTVEVEDEYWASGAFGNVDTLRNLAEKAMSRTIDKVLSDNEFIQPLLSTSSRGIDSELTTNR